MMLLIYFCLFVDHVNKSSIIGFEAFVYYFKNTIPIFVTICTFLELDFMFSIGFKDIQ